MLYMYVYALFYVCLDLSWFCLTYRRWLHLRNYVFSFFRWDIVYSGAYIVYCMLVYYFSVQSRTIYAFGATSFAPAVETSKITFYLPVSSLHHMKDENFRLVSPIDSDMNMHNHKVGSLPAISRGSVITCHFFFWGYKPSYPSIRPFRRAYDLQPGSTYGPPL